MIVVIDANILFSALISPSGKTADLIFSNELELHTPEFILSEFAKHKKTILEKTGFTDEELYLLHSTFSSVITTTPHSFFDPHMKHAGQVSPDPDDEEYFALALYLNCPIWSNDKRLKEQEEIEVLNTEEIIKRIKTT